MEIHFAPLQGYTEAAYRNAHATLFGGVDAYYTPFVRLEKGQFRNKDLRDTNPANNQPVLENPQTQLIPQLIAGGLQEAETIARKLSEEGYGHIDLNMGCPFPLIARQGKGCGILHDAARVAELLRITQTMPQLTFSVKMRLGWESPEESMQLLPLLNEARLTHITLHPRIGRQQYKGECDMEAFAQFYAECKHPLLYNGDLNTLEEIIALTTRFPALKGIMLGRGLLAHPWLAADFKTYEAGGSIPTHTYDQVRALHQQLLTHYQATLQGEAQLMTKLHPIWDYLLPDAEKRLRKKITKARKLTDYLQAVGALLR